MDFFKNTFTLLLFIPSLLWCIDNAKSERISGEVKTTPTTQFAESKDVYLLASLISSESYCTDIEDMYRVGSVVLNRVQAREFPNALHKVIYQTNQFDGVGRFNFKPDHCEDAIKVARELLSGGPKKEMRGILYYFNPQVSGTESEWCKRMVDNVVIKGKYHWYSKL